MKLKPVEARFLARRNRAFQLLVTIEGWDDSPSQALDALWAIGTLDGRFPIMAVEVVPVVHEWHLTAADPNGDEFVVTCSCGDGDGPAGFTQKRAEEWGRNHVESAPTMRKI